MCRRDTSIWANLKLKQLLPNRRWHRCWWRSKDVILHAKADPNCNTLTKWRGLERWSPTRSTCREYLAMSNIRSPKTFTAYEWRHSWKFLPERSRNMATKCYEHVCTRQNWVRTFLLFISVPSYCILVAALCRQDGQEQSVRRRWAEHVQWSSQHERRVVQHMPRHQTSRPTKSWASNQTPKFGHFILNQCMLKQHEKHTKRMPMLRELAAEGQAPALQVWDQCLCLLRAQVSCDETAHFMSSHGEQSSRGYDVVVSSATHTTVSANKKDFNMFKHVQTCSNMFKHVQTYFCMLKHTFAC